MQRSKLMNSFEDSTGDQIFSWNRNSPMIRPDVLKCVNCNHTINSEGECAGRRCGGCGHPIRLYGYRELVYDPIDDNDERPYDLAGAEPVSAHRIHHRRRDGRILRGLKHIRSNVGPNIDVEMEENVQDGDGVNGVIEEELHRDGVQVEGEHNVVEVEEEDEQVHVEESEAGLGSEQEVVYDEEGNHVVLPDNTTEEIEHMEGSSIALYGFVCCWLLTFLIALCIAHFRGELVSKDRSVNLSLVGCVFFFPQMYMTYALFEWIVRPKQCIQW